MKLAGVLLVLTVGPATAQPPGVQYGHRLGSNLVFLTESPDAAEPGEDQGQDPRLRGIPPALLEAMRDPSVTLSVEQMNTIRALLAANAVEAQSATLAARANFGAEFPFVTIRGGSTTPFLFSARPSAAFDTWAEQQSSDYAESAKIGFTGIDRTEGKAILRRFVRDDFRQIYVSYAATVETLPDGIYRVSFGPSEDELPADLRGKAGWKLLSPARYPPPQVMKDGDSVALELYSNGTTRDTTRSTTRRVVDYVHVGRQDRMVMRKEAPHDSYAADAELAVTQPRVRVNGVTAPAAASPETIRGSELWVYVPGHGRYVLSLHPLPDLGFEGVGEAAGNSLTFTSADGDVFRLDAAERIAAGSGSYIVYVSPDPGWEPADPQDRVLVTLGVTPGFVADDPY
jgi:hypothetical protein